MSTSAQPLSTMAQAVSTASSKLAAATVSLSKDTENIQHVSFRIIKAIPGALLWLITFTTVTLPTWLFTFFSTGLTITMNATTL